MPSLETLFKNTSKLVQKIENELEKEIGRRITALAKGVASELTTQLKGKPLDDIRDLARQYTMDKNLSFNDMEILSMKEDTFDLKIKKVVWAGDWSSDYAGNYECNLVVYYEGPNGTDSVNLTMEFKMEL